MNNFFSEQEKKCGRCGKEFLATSEWVYKKGCKYYCSWGCYRAGEKSKETPAERREKIIQAINDGLNVNEIATLLGVDKSMVVYWQNKLGRAKDDA